MSGPIPNVELLTRTLAHVETHPFEWTQDIYRCTSGKCYAGWTCDLAGGRWLTPEANHRLRDFLVAEPEDGPTPVVHLDMPVVSVHFRARRLLGLSAIQALDLFHPDNSLDDLRRLVRAISATAPTTAGA